MKKHKLENISLWLSLGIIAGGMIVVIGWVIDIDILTRLLPNKINMKFITALTFVLSGVSMLYIKQIIKGKTLWPQIILPATAMLILLFMFTLLASGIFGVRTGIENLFVKDGGSVNTVRPGMPALPTMLCFIIFGINTIVALLGNAYLLKKFLVSSGYIIFIIGIFAVFGYIINQPILYWLVTANSVPIAINTSLLFALLGLDMIITSKLIKADPRYYEN